MNIIRTREKSRKKEKFSYQQFLFVLVYSALHHYSYFCCILLHCIDGGEMIKVVKLQREKEKGEKLHQ